MASSLYLSCASIHHRLAETKGKCILRTFEQLAADLVISHPLGLDYLDREKAKRQAVEQAHHLANERYGHGHNGVNYLRQNGGYGNDYNPGYGGGYNRLLVQYLNDLEVRSCSTLLEGLLGMYISPSDRSNI